jgi:hypothetical protein
MTSYNPDFPHTIELVLYLALKDLATEFLFLFRCIKFFLLVFKEYFLNYHKIRNHNII